ncbi:MAG: helix-turn-helix transcriptional regulator [Nitrospira sp.]|nr:MAG: helix-turn-helix transcriptional regulator [Nitrospira sp.]
MTRPARWTTLSSKEKDVLMLFAEGRTNAAIARPLGISPRTVQKHLERIFLNWVRVRGPRWWRWSIGSGLSAMQDRRFPRGSIRNT